MMGFFNGAQRRYVFGVRLREPRRSCAQRMRTSPEAMR
jgi:hypothetical protein